MKTRREVTGFNKLWFLAIAPLATCGLLVSCGLAGLFVSRARPQVDGQAETQPTTPEPQAVSKPADSTDADVAVSSSGLMFRMYEANEMNADSYFKGKRVALVGAVLQVTHSHLALHGPGIKSTRVTYKGKARQQAERMHQGETVVVIGKVKGMSFGTVLGFEADRILTADEAQAIRVKDRIDE